MAIRSSASNSGSFFTDPVVTETTSSSKRLRGALDDVDVPVGDRVVGPRADGDAVSVDAHRPSSRRTLTAVSP